MGTLDSHHKTCRTIQSVRGNVAVIVMRKCITTDVWNQVLILRRGIDPDLRNTAEVIAKGLDPFHIPLRIVG